ncbi:hypothetical protein FHS89_000993 [Rubricella aquisinus]|uniref:Cobalamin biosynthesis protein CobQ n=1 Tax=Rubricella aquisinus TaxID=2028108 RepID=A0A840WLG1_9RHOB|nr:cobalamin biosynthesis protein CobQ [Rubricella aquisinus]MBB5514983.1 hypothetical protein [Rubricella aquisinus]
MNTPAHLIFAAAAFARAEKEPGDGARAVNGAALLGGLLPDFSLYFAFLWGVGVLGLTPAFFFGEVYFWPPMQAVFAVDNSFVVWSFLLGVALTVRHLPLIAFAGSGLLHLLFDFTLHNDDARMHFWPVSDWVFISPVSYWDPDHYGGIAALAEIAICVALLALLWRRFSGVLAKILITLGLATQVLPGLVWAFMF